MPKISADFTQSDTSQKSSPKSSKPFLKLASSEKPVLHEKITPKLCQGKMAITADDARKLLGWTEAPKDATDFQYHDGEHKIYLNHNLSNRPIYGGRVEILKQEILRGNWKLNGEPLIVGKHGSILNGQHCLLALIAAVDEYAEAPGNFPAWDSEPTIDKVMIQGVDEDDETVNTLDTCKPRSLLDVIYRSYFFQDKSPRDRKRASGLADYAVRLLWDRTGANDNGVAYRTLSESIHFIDRHQRLLEAIDHIFNEDADSGIQKYFPSGYACGLLYLMGSCKSDGDRYRELRDESPLDWEYFEQATEFWTLFAAGARNFSPLRKALSQGRVEKDEKGEEKARSLTHSEKRAIVIKAWLLFQQGKPLTPERLELKYEPNEDGFLILAETPTTGGIDIAAAAPPEAIDEDSEDQDEETAAREESIQGRVAERAAQVRQEREGKKRHKKAGKKLETKPDESFAIGEEVWVRAEEEEGHWSGTIVELYDDIARIKVGQGFAGAGSEYEAAVETLQYEQP